MARFNFTSSRGERSWMEKIQGSRQSRDFARKRVHTNVQRHVCLFLGVEIRITGKRNPRFLRRPPLPPPPFPPSLLLLLLLLMLLASPEPALTRIIIFPIPDESFVTKLPREGSPPFSALSEPICLETPLGLPCYGWSRPNPREIALWRSWVCGNGQGATDTRLRDTFNHFAPLTESEDVEDFFLIERIR